MQPELSQNFFYVYEHLKKDDHNIFYVGKGSKRRAYVSNKHHRSDHWHKTVNKHGGFDVRFIASGVDEELAFLIEMERIDQLRKLGIKLCNQTDGGDGVFGYVRTQETKDKIGAAHRGKTMSAEVRKKISESVLRLKYTHTDDAKRRMSESHMGHKRNVGRKQSADEIARRALTLIGNKHRAGKKRSERENALTSAALLGRPQPICTCPVCGKQGGNAMKRWHFDNCKIGKHVPDTNS